MARNTEKSWFNSAAELIVRHGMTIRQAVLELNLDLTAQDCDRVYHTKAFQEILRTERHRLNTEIANDPNRTKTSLIGLGYQLIQKLIEEGQWEKAIAGIEKLAKIEGWSGAESQINIFQGLTAKDIAEERARIEQEISTIKPTSTDPWYN